MHILDTLAPYLAGAGEFLINLDQNESGGDDFAGQAIAYSAEVIGVVRAGGDIPAVPDIIIAGTTEKLSPIVRSSLLGVATMLAIAVMQTTGQSQVILKYIQQALRALLAGRSVPPAPDTVTIIVPALTPATETA